jgi:transcriptional regulator with XRE-family HTH domain
MSSINERFRKVREHLKLTQTDFATMANRTRSEISNIEYNKTSPKEEVIKAVCAAHGINRRYLETGEAPMLMPAPEDDASYINDLLSEFDNPFFDIIRAILKAYSESSPEDKKALDAFVQKLPSKMQKKNRD